MISDDLDLFGNPITQVERGRGRPAHKRTAENVNKVIVLLAMGKSKKEVCRAIGITQPTFHKHYFSEWEQRQAHLDRLEALGLMTLIDGAREGKPAAAAQLLKRIDRAKLESIAAAVNARGDAAAKKAAKKPLGKKEAAVKAAKEAEGKFVPPEAPRFVN